MESLTLNLNCIPVIASQDETEGLMLGRTILATLPGQAPCERLQVGLVQDRDGTLRIDLREQHYAEKIGWFDQRGLELSPSQFQQLQAVLGLKPAVLDALVSAAPSPATIPFPGPGSSSPVRHAVGDER
jgi:hypothetical protein